MKKSIKYYSTNLKSPEVSFRDALLKGLAPDGGLYMPDAIPNLDKKELESFSGMNYPEIACSVLSHFLADEIGGSDLQQICDESYDFDVPLEKVYGFNYLLRLDRGPTASFKDFAARMMAKLMNYFASRDGLHFTILTATSGDTGSAVANAFHELENIDVIILFPSGEVSEIQRKQMTTLKKNIRVIALDGKFDDCQRFVKQAFLDPSLSEVSLSSANSINIGRLLPQSVYYFYSWSKLAGHHREKVVFSIPSGNFGDMMGGLIAREMGLPVTKFIISTNSNKEFAEYLRTGNYNPVNPSVNCISSAMNVGHPSNLARVIALYGGVMNEKGIIVKEPDLKKMRKDLYGISVTDEETRSTISSFYKDYGIVLEPHGAVAWNGLRSYLEKEDSKDHLSISLETAHPAKFNDEIKELLGFSPPLPESLLEIEKIKEDYTELDNNYEKLKEFILMR